MIGVHGAAGDGRWPALGNRERPDLGGGEHHQVVALEEFEHRLQQRCAHGAGGHQIGGGDAAGLFELPHCLGLQRSPAGVVLDSRAQAMTDEHPPKGDPRRPHLVEIDIDGRRLDGGTGALESAQSGGADVENARLHREVITQVAEPANGQLAWVEPVGRVVRVEERRVGRLGDREGVARVPTGLSSEQGGDVADRSSHRPVGGDAANPTLGRGPVGDTTVAGAETEDVVPGRRVPQRAAVVAAIGDGEKSMGQGGRRTTAGATGRMVGGVCVGGRSEDRVERVRAEAELGHVGFADHDAPGGPHPLGEQTVVLGAELGEQGRARGRRESGRVVEILDRLGDAVHPAARQVGGEFGVAFVGLLEQRVVGGEVDDRVGGGVESVDAVEVGGHHLTARHQPGVDRLRQVDRAQVGDGVGRRGVGRGLVTSHPRSLAVTTGPLD